VVALAVGGHDHVLTVGFSIGPLVLRLAVLVAVPVVACFAMLRGFLPEPDRRTTFGVVLAAGAATLVELLLSGGLRLPEQTVPLLLAALALPLYLIRSCDPRFAPFVARARAFAPWMFGLCAVLAAVELGRAWLDGAVTGLHTGVVLALVGLAWFAVARPRRLVAVVRVAAAAVGLAMIAATAQAVVLRPQEPVPGVATAGLVETGAGAVEVTIVPNLPGWNLVHVAANGAKVGVTRSALAPAEPRPGTSGGWAAVRLPAGRAEVMVGYRGAVGSLVTDTGPRGGAVAPAGLPGPDGPECASALLGAAVAGLPTPTRCPTDTLDPADADALRMTVGYLADQGRREVTVVADRTPRGLAAADVIRTAAAEAGLMVRPSPPADAATFSAAAGGSAMVTGPETEAGAMVVVAGWANTATALRSAPAATAVHLAPWLATGSLPLIVPDTHLTRRFAPDHALTTHYVAALRDDYPGVSPSPAGLRAWLSARAGVERTPAPQVVTTRAGAETWSGRPG
jgi:hypothetical protein